MKTKLIVLMMLVFSAYLVSAQGIKVTPNTCIKVESGTTLDISGSGDLVLESDASPEASLIDYGNVTYTGGGEAKVERYLTESTNDYHDITPLTCQLSIMQAFYKETKSNKMLVLKATGNYIFTTKVFNR
jgi:hypothetical protein